MSTTLINRSRRRLVLQLAHPQFERKRFGWQRRVIRTRDHNPRTGAVGIRETNKSLIGSLSLPAGSRLEGLPDIIAAVPDVKRAVARGDLELVRVADKAPMPIAAPKVAEPVKNGRKAKEG